MPPKHRSKRLKTNLTIKSMPEEQILFVKVAPDKRISVYVNLADTRVVSVVMKIYEKTGQLPNQIILCFRSLDNGMCPSTKLSDYGIQEYDTIDLLVQGMMWVVMADGVDDEKFAITVWSLDTIGTLKTTIWLETGLLPGRQEIGKFPEQMTLSELNMGFGSTLLVQVLPEEEDISTGGFWGQSSSKWKGRGIPSTGRRARTTGWRWRRWY